ncbi:probable palmitoyltransferase ZDHHC24 isoform X2 [Anastrepha obliqua]|uniref:probable palmitoyltransferase ZDHHC24 isoform X2 n=1 Tax=Anastrepha obliqua TaxID=95512 RepID=UPI00240A583E|nr:probable palmitoyltransferase ZDHHC24 isoform X2 [Anastrepha obliqua]
MQIRVRKQFFPRRLGDIFCFLLITVFFPIVAVFDVVVVVPAIHTPGEFMHSLIFTIAMFLIFNIQGNMLAAMMVDTSIDVCRKCILKCDHHCVFTGCCIGHYNVRYFALFLVYMFFGSLLSFLYLSFYLFWIHANTFRHILSLYKMLCPVLMLVSGSRLDNFSLVFYNLNIIALVISSILMVYHGIPLIKGGTSYERRCNYPYRKDLRSNLCAIFGKRMYLVWISPFISSELLDDGVNWEESSENAPLLGDAKIKYM